MAAVLIAANRPVREQVRDKLIQDGCFNIAIAGVIVRIYLREAHRDLVAAVGYYHSHTPWRHREYLTKAVDAALRLSVAPRSSSEPVQQPAFDAGKKH